MKIATKDLVGRPLLYAVCLAEGFEPYVKTVVTKVEKKGEKPLEVTTHSVRTRSREIADMGWALCGPIVDREKISISYDSPHPSGHASIAVFDKRSNFKHRFYGYGPGLIGAMRCYVLMKLGKEVEIPEQLLE